MDMLAREADANALLGQVEEAMHDQSVASCAYRLQVHSVTVSQ